MIWLLVNLLLAAPFVAIWVGVPLWLVLRHPDQDARPRAASGYRPQAVASPARSHRPSPPTRNPRPSADAASMSWPSAEMATRHPIKPGRWSAPSTARAPRGTRWEKHVRPARTYPGPGPARTATAIKKEK